MSSDNGRGIRPTSRIRILAFAVVVLNAVGNLCLSLGMRSQGAVVSLSPLDYIRTFANPWILAGIALLIGWLLAQLSILSWADLTYVLPITATSFALSAILGAVFLHERVAVTRWSGILLISAGVLIVSRTKPRTGAAL